MWERESVSCSPSDHPKKLWSDFPSCLLQLCLLHSNTGCFFFFHHQSTGIATGCVRVSWGLACAVGGILHDVENNRCESNVLSRCQWAWVRIPAPWFTCYSSSGSLPAHGAQYEALLHDFNVRIAEMEHTQNTDWVMVLGECLKSNRLLSVLALGNRRNKMKERTQNMLSCSVASRECRSPMLTPRSGPLASILSVLHPTWEKASRATARAQ